MPAQHMFHCGGAPATIEEIGAIELPEATPTYRPVPHGDLVRLVEEEMKRSFGIDKPERSFGLANEGKRMFGTLTYQLVDSDVEDVEPEPKIDLDAFNVNLDVKALTKYGYSIALRNSYDKSMGVGIAGGVNTFVCDNLALTGSDFAIKAPHTKNVWESLVPKVVLRIRDSLGEFEHAVNFLEKLKSKNMSMDDAYRMVGVARGRGLITSSQENVLLSELRACEKASRDWQKEVNRPVHTFAPYHGTPYALYQHFTEALKLGADVSRKMDVYTGVSHLFEEQGLVGVAS